MGNTTITTDLSKKEYLSSLDKSELYVMAQERIQTVMAMVREDPKVFIFNYCVTLDPQDSRNPKKVFPNKEYLNLVIDYWIRERLVMVVKSRQMMITWLMVALHLWYAMYFQGRHVFFISKKEDDADYLIGRVKFIYDNLPEWLRIPCSRKYCMLRFDGIDSIIQGVSQDSDAIRTHTASAILSDEMGFQPYSRQSFQSSRPTLESGGKYTGVSSINGKEFFYNMCYDLE